ncbi:MAG: prepilin peptidase [Candidatus Planktophila sp.]
MALLLIAIAIFDLKFHRIPNVSVALVVLLDLALGSSPNSFSLLLFLIPASFLAWRYLRIGGGDIKLLGAMLVFVLPRESLSDYVFNFLLCAIALMLIYIVRGATLKIAIPLAPAISGGYLLSILA